VTNAAPHGYRVLPGFNDGRDALHRQCLREGKRTGEQVELMIREMTTSGTGVSYHTASVTLRGTAAADHCDYTAVHSGDALRYSLYVSNFATSTQYFLADCLSLQTKTKATAVKSGAADELYSGRLAAQVRGRM